MLRLTTAIMASVKSDKVKQSLDDLEKYCLLQKVTSNRSFTKNSSSVVPYSARSYWKENVSFTYTTSINSRRKKQPRNVFQKFFTSVVQSWSGLHRMLADFWYLFGWLHSWFLHFSWIEHSSKTIKASNPFTVISLFWNFYEKDSINRMNDGQANH